MTVLASLLSLGVVVGLSAGEEAGDAVVEVGQVWGDTAQWVHLPLQGAR